MVYNGNPHNLKIGYRYLVRHKSELSPWIEVYIAHIAHDGIPIGRNSEQNFYEAITDKYEVEQINSIEKEEAQKAWLERASRDKKHYPSEINAFEYYWQMSH